jgi:hypothetical protein
LDRVWERLGIGAAIRAAAAGRRLDAEAVERVIFALVAQRALEPGSKLAATRWVAERVAIEGCPGFDADAAYAAMDFLLDALGEVAAGVFDRTATLLNLSCDVIFVDTTSTYWELDGADELADLAEQAGDDETASPEERAVRTWGALQGPPPAAAPGGDRHGGDPGGGADPVLDLPGQHRRHRDHPPDQGRPDRLAAAPAGLGGRPCR